MMISVMYMYMSRGRARARARASGCPGCAVLLCLVVCLTLLASFFLPSHLSLKTCIYIHVHYNNYYERSSRDSNLEFLITSQTLLDQAI